MRRRIVTTALAAAALSTIACDRGSAQSAAAVAETPAEEARVPVRVAKPEVGPISRYLVASSTISASGDVTIQAKVAGRVERVLVEVGDRVRKGSLLAKIEDREYRLAMERARIERDKAKSEFERSEELFKRELVSGQVHQNAEFAYRAAQNAYETAQLTLDETEIRSPIAGTVVQRDVVHGANAQPAQPLFRVVDFASLELALYVPEKEAAKVRLGQNVELVADSYPDLALTLPITLVDPIINPATGTQRILVKVPLGDPRLKPGLFVRARILTETHESAVLIPRKALLLQGEANRVFVARDGRAA
ncbi:MAG: efflux RND transporter periplasmic adaptor subunit, partial [Candidatus Methylomirabilis sp.]|nr:efflux RND transporter periplasmic adaptor subunit [Deltaproteobacteria bacterium]